MTCKSCHNYNECKARKEELREKYGCDTRIQLELEITKEKLMGEYSCFVPNFVMCDVCVFNEKNGGDCNRMLPITRRDPVTETNVTEYSKLEFCSHGAKEK